MTPRAIAWIRKDEGLTHLCSWRDCREHLRPLDRQSLDSFDSSKSLIAKTDTLTNVYYLAYLLVVV